MWLLPAGNRFGPICYLEVHTSPILFLLFSIFLLSKYIQVVELYPCGPSNSIMETNSSGRSCFRKRSERSGRPPLGVGNSAGFDRPMLSRSNATAERRT
jgi:hypothetical protein